MPPFAGAENATISEFVPLEAVGADGVFGTVVAVIELDVVEAVEVPFAFVAVVVNV